MNRCQTHGLLNCKCRESLAAYLAKQFRESGSDRVDRRPLDGAGVRVGAVESRGPDGRNMGRGEKQ